MRSTRTASQPGRKAERQRRNGEPVAGFDEEIRAYDWLRRTIEMLAEGDTPEEFLEHTKLELFQDQVFCFTPKGRLIALPRGATPIDFAYAVHTDVGDTCVGAKINGRIMPLMTELQNGDEVEIIRSKAQVPPAAWESIVVTGKARAAIRRATRAAVRKQYAGPRPPASSSAPSSAPAARSTTKLLKAALPRLAQQQRRGRAGRRRARRDPVDDVLQGGLSRPQGGAHGRAGRAKERGGLVRPAARRRHDVPACPACRASGRRPSQRRPSSAIPIRGLGGDLPVRFAEGGAVPGDRIVGILTPGEGITIYPIQSPALKAFDDQPERWLDVRWDIDEERDRALPGAHRGDRDQRAGHAGPDRPGHRRQRRQHPQSVDDPQAAPDFTGDGASTSRCGT